MTRVEAQEILSAHRPNCSPEDLPGLVEALALAERDPDLAAWFEREQAFDRRLTGALEAIPVPEGLKDRNLAQSRKALSSSADGDRVVGFPSRRFWVATAAAMVVLSVVGLVKHFYFPPPVEFPAGNFASVMKFCDDMAYYANRPFVLGKRTGDFDEARDWLKDRGSPVFPTTPKAIADLGSLGCQTFFWGEKKVSLVCFRNRADEVVHLFVIDCAVFEKTVSPADLRKVRVLHERQTGGWLSGDHLYLLVGSEAEVQIEEILASAVGQV